VTSNCHGAPGGGITTEVCEQFFTETVVRLADSMLLPVGQTVRLSQ